MKVSIVKGNVSINGVDLDMKNENILSRKNYHETWSVIFSTLCYNQVAVKRDTCDIESLHECPHQQRLDSVPSGEELRVLSYLRGHDIWISASSWGSGDTWPLWHHPLPPAQTVAGACVVHQGLGWVACFTHQGGSTVYRRSYCKAPACRSVVSRFQSNNETTLCWWCRT